MHAAEAPAELSAVEEVAEFADHEARQRVARLVVEGLGEEGGEVFGEDSVQSSDGCGHVSYCSRTNP